MDYKEKLRLAKEALDFSSYDKETIEYIFPELAESEDEKVRKAIYNCVKWFGFDSSFFKDVSQEECLAWLETQGQNFTKKDVDDAYLKGICDAKHELEKQGEQKPWSKESIATISRAISIVKWAAYSDHSHPILNDEGATELVEWLNFLKDRIQHQTSWKPSDGQMTALRRMKATIAGEGEIYEPLNSLYKDLKKLREE